MIILQLKRLAFLISVLPMLAFAQATIFVPADNAVKAQKPNFQIMESGTGGQVFEFAVPSLASKLTWALPASYCASGELLGFSDGTGTLACVDPSAFGFITSVTDTNSIDLDVTTNVLTADLNLSAAAADAGKINAEASIEADGLQVQVPEMVGDSGAGGVSGVVPAPGIGDAANCLLGDGTWGTCGGGGGLITSVTDTNSIDLTETAGDLTADLNLSVAAADAGNINAVNSIEADGLQTQVPVLVGDSGSGGTAGVVPAPAAGDAAADKFLKADGTWETPAGSGGGGFTANSDTTLTASDTLAIGTTAADALQHWRVKGNSGAVTMDPEPFGTTPPPDRTLICVMGISDADPVTFQLNDAADGIVGNGPVTLHAYQSACFRYVSTEDRYVIESRSL